MSISNVYKMRARALEDLKNFVAPEMLPMPGVIPGATTSSWREIVREIAETGQTTSVDKTLDARAEMYGKFKDGAALMQSIKRTLADHAAKHGKTFADDQWEALEMIVHKIGRIVNGDPDVTDHWVDIAGYATLIAERLEGNAR
jgi:DNA repair photolyase